MRHLKKLFVGLIIAGSVAPPAAAAETQEQKCQEIQITNPFDPYCLGYLEGLAVGRTSAGTSATIPVGVGTVGTFIGTPDNGVLIGTSNRVTVIQSLENLGVEVSPDLAKAMEDALSAEGLDPSIFNMTLQREGMLNNITAGE